MGSEMHSCRYLDNEVCSLGADTQYSAYTRCPSVRTAGSTCIYLVSCGRQQYAEPPLPVSASVQIGRNSRRPLSACPLWMTHNHTVCVVIALLLY